MKCYWSYFAVFVIGYVLALVVDRLHKKAARGINYGEAKADIRGNTFQ